MSKIAISLFASANRPLLWPSYLKSLESTTVSYEVVFAGDVRPNQEIVNSYLKYIHTGRIKPGQCYALASRECTGETISWSCDDANYDNDVLGKAYRYWKAQNNEKLILSIQTKESGYGNPEGSLFDMDIHRFFGGDRNSPLMAPMCLMSRDFFNDLGGYDRRYVSGQTENDIVMRAYTQGATVEIFGGPECFIDIDHLKKSIDIGESTDEKDFLNRPFAQGYAKDREVLEKSWTIYRQDKLMNLLTQGRREFYQSEIKEISQVQLDQFEPYTKDISLTESESNKGIWD